MSATRASAVVIVGALALAAACGVESPCPPADLGAPRVTPSFAVVTSDRFSTAVALLDADGALLDEAWVDSGTVRPGIAAALSGDVILPSAPLAGELVLIDRFGVDVVTRIGLEDGVVRAQLPTQLGRDESTSGFRANPHDVIELDDGRLLVSRHEPNTDPLAPPLDRGNDLVLVDPEVRALVGRVDLAALDVEVEGTHVFARPSRMARVGRFVVVGLVGLDLGFSVPGPGAVGLVDLGSLVVSAVPIDGLTNCGEVRPFPDDPERVVVTCSGATFAGAEARRRSAGLALLHVTTAGTVVETVFRASEHLEAPPPSGPPMPLGGMRVAVVAAGDEAAADALLTVDLATSESTVVFEASGAFVLGTGALDGSRTLLLVPDAGEGVRRVRVEDGALTPMDVVDVSPCRRLGAREVGVLR